MFDFIRTINNLYTISKNLQAKFITIRLIQNKMKIKNLLFIIILLVFVLGLNAQDSIFKVNGEKISAKVLEVGTDNVKYRKSSNMDGPLYTIAKGEIKEIFFENGDKESFSNSLTKTSDSQIKNSRKSVFIKTTSDSDMRPTQEVWKEEIERCSQLKKVDSLEESSLIFEFRIKRALGEARVSVIVYESSGNKKLWESDKYRGTANVYNRMGASLDGIRKCISKGIIRSLESGTF